MTLKEVIEDFAEFDFSESEVREALAAGDSSFNAYEGLKILLEIKWLELKEDLDADLLEGLKPVRDRLMGLKMTSRTTKPKEEKVVPESERRNKMDEFIRYSQKDLEERVKAMTPEERNDLKRRLHQMTEQFIK